jgi:hypothetical protein
MNRTIDRILLENIGTSPDLSNPSRRFPFNYEYRMKVYFRFPNLVPNSPHISFADVGMKRARPTTYRENSYELERGYSRVKDGMFPVVI